MCESPTRELADFASGLVYEAIPEEVVKHLKWCILDGVGVGLFGSTLPWVSIMSDLIKALGGTEESPVWGKGYKTSSVNASLVNGTACHAFELDDTHRESICHLAPQVLPAVAAAAAYRDLVSGKEFLTAIAAGYEVCIRVGMCMAVSCAMRGFHVPGVVAPFGAAVGVGNLLRLDRERMINALGIAGSQAAGLQGSQLGMAKRMQPGRGAQSGLISALLAERGFTGMATVLDDVEYGGFFKCYADEFQIGRLLEGLGRDYEICRIGFKPYACCRSNHTTLDALKELMERHPEIRPDAIENIRIECSTITRKYGWVTEIDSVGSAQASIPFCAAVMCSEGDAFIEQFLEEKIRDKRILHLMSKVEMVANPDWDRLGAAHRWRVEVEVRLNNGNIFRTLKENPRGVPENPLTSQEIRDKFGRLASGAAGSERAKKIAECIERLEELENVHALLEMLA
ncbi:MAG: MmgE/PrpD family protein [Deltaproteobacteria bacterium]|nr:MmgE/PrpD family protein [Deltaproteobacteria bacterium]